METKGKLDIQKNNIPTKRSLLSKYLGVILFFIEVVLVVIMIQYKGMSPAVLYTTTAIMGILLFLIIGIFIRQELVKLKHRDDSSSSAGPPFRHSPHA